MPCYTTVIGTNADLIKEACDLYLRPGARICDPTFGKGVFWRKVDLTKFHLFPSDLLSCPHARYDYRNLPYSESCFDLVTIDPPYSHTGRTARVFEKNYRNLETTRGLNNAKIIERYIEGMKEAWRVLVRGGLLFVKCQDELESQKQRRSHIVLYHAGLQMGFDHPITLNYFSAICFILF